MIQVRHLSFTYQGMKTPVFHNLEFEVHPGQIMTVLGPNGSGKTTLFQCLTGLWQPDCGEVLLDGASPRSMPRSEVAKRVAVVPQDHQPPFAYSVMDVVLTGRAAHIGLFSSPSRHDRLVARQALATMGVEGLADRPYTQISGGERQMVLIARCLAQEASTILLDEPTSHLDFRNQVVVLSSIRTLVGDKRLTVIMNLHDPNLALLFSDQVLLLSGRGTAAQGPPREVITKENLQAVYGLQVEFLSGNGLEMVCPKLG